MDYGDLSRYSLERLLRFRDRQAKTSSTAWAKAAAQALQILPGASNSTHPAHSLWLRVEMQKQPFERVELSSPALSPGDPMTEMIERAFADMTEADLHKIIHGYYAGRGAPWSNAAAALDELYRRQKPHPGNGAP